MSGIGPPPSEPDGTEGTATVELTLKDEHDESKKNVYTRNGLIISSLDNDDFTNFLNTNTQNTEFFIYFCSTGLPGSWKDCLVKYEIKVHRFTESKDDKFYTIDQNAAEGIVVKGCHIFLPLNVGKFKPKYKNKLTWSTSKFCKFLNEYSKDFSCNHQEINCSKKYKGLIIGEVNDSLLIKLVKITFSSDNNRLELRDELFDKLIDGPLLLCNGKDHAVGWCAKVRDNSSKITWYKFKPEGATDIVWKKSSALETVKDSSSGNSDPPVGPSNHEEAQDTVDCASNAVNSHHQTPPDFIPKGEKYNFFRFQTLVYEEGSKVLRKIFDEKRDVVLERFKEPSIEKKLKRILNPQLIAKGFSSADCDISSLCVLLRFADLEPEQSTAIDQIRRIRNKLAHSTDIALSDNEFKRRRTEIVDLLVQLGGEKYRNEMLKATQGEKDIFLAFKDLEALQQELQIIWDNSIKGSGTGDYKLYSRPPDIVGSQQQGQDVNDDLDLVTLLDSDERVGDGLALRLDHEDHDKLRSWRHLANEMGAPVIIIKKCEIDTVHSPTLLLLKYPNVSRIKVDELIKKLRLIGRMDLVSLLDFHIPKANQGKSLNDTLLKKDDVLDNLACKLDLRSKVNKNWRDLGKSLELEPWRLDLIEKGNNPTKELLDYVYIALQVTAGKFRQTIDGFQDRPDVVDLLTKYQILPEDNRTLKEVVKPDSEVMRKLCELLNNNFEGTAHDWKSVACELEIPHETYRTFDLARRSSPTKKLLDWVRSNKDLSVYNLLDYLKNIERNDARAFLLDKRNEYLEKKNKQTNKKNQN